MPRIRGLHPELRHTPSCGRRILTEIQKIAHGPSQGLGVIGALRLCLVWAFAAGLAQGQPLSADGGGAAAHATKSDAQVIVHRFLKCWATGDAATFSALLDPGVVFAYPGGRFDKSALLQTFTDYQLQKKDIRIYFSDFFISDGHRHVTSYQFAATDRTTGLRFAVGTGVICKIRDGKIVEFKEYWDNEVPGRQKLGELPLDEGKIVAPWPSSVLLRAEKIN